MAEKVEVEWIATAASMTAALDKINTRLEKQDKALEKIGETSIKTNNSAIGSYKRLEQELKQNEARLKQMAMGTAEFAEQKKKVDALKNSLAEAKGELVKTGAAGGGILSAGVGQLAQMTAGIVGLHTAVSIVVGELDKVKTMRLEAAAATRTVEESLADMAINVGAANVGEARQTIEDNASRLGVSQEGLASLLAAGISGGAENIQEAMKLAESTLRLTAGNATKAAPIMSGLLSLASTTGNRDFESALGQLSQFQAAARGEDLATSINNMNTALAAANTRGDRVAPLGAERTLEMSSVMSQALQDPTMAITGTALRQMVQKMDLFTAVTEKKLDDGTKAKLTKQEADAFNALGTIDERIQAMRANPVIGQQFLSGIEDNQSKVAIREIVKGTERVREMETAAAKIITDAAGGKTEFDNLTAVIAENTTAVQRRNKSDAGVQELVVGSERAKLGEAEEIVQKVFDSVDLKGPDWLLERTLQAGRAVSEQTGVMAPEESAVALLQQMLDRTLTSEGRQRDATVQNEEDRRFVESQLALLIEIRDELKAARAKPAGPAMRPREAALPAATVP